MSVIIVVENPKNWPLDLPNVEVVSASDFIASERYSNQRGAKVFNLCRRFGYQSLGYYVSILATARGHRPLPSVATLQDLRLAPILRIAADESESLIQRLLADLRLDRFVLSIYFGHNMASRYDRLCRMIFNQFPAPLLRAEFARKGKLWRLERIRAIGTSEIPETHRPFVVEQALRYLDRPIGSRRVKPPRFEMAILVNPEEPQPPSDEQALNRFLRAAKKLGIGAELVEKDDYGRIGEYDALFIRETTAVNHHTYRFARRAAAEGLVVIDDPESILRCTNKVYQAELFNRCGIPIPKTLIVDEDSIEQIEKEIGYPCVIKRPDSSFSKGVTRATGPDELRAQLEQSLEDSELAVVQEYVPSEFDWRVGVLEGRPLYVCKYFMVKGHWQIISTGRAGKVRSGAHETMSVEDAPRRVVRLAVRAARAIGNGLYGVDIKQVKSRFLIMEVNDNPSIESGVEDAVRKQDLYTDIMSVFLDRLERLERKAGAK